MKIHVAILIGICSLMVQGCQSSENHESGKAFDELVGEAAKAICTCSENAKEYEALQRARAAQPEASDSVNKARTRVTRSLETCKQQIDETYGHLLSDPEFQKSVKVIMQNECPGI